MAQAIKYPGLIDFVKQKIQEGRDVNEIFNVALKKFKYNGSRNQFRKYVNNVKSRHVNNQTDQVQDQESFNQNPETIDDVEEFINILKDKKNVKMVDLCNDLFCSPQRAENLVNYYRSKGFDISIHEGRVMLNMEIVSSVNKMPQLEDKEIVFGVASDLHFGSKACQLTALNEFCKICESRGVRHIFSPGDIVAGHNVYPGQQFDLYALSAEEQEESVITNLPLGKFQWYLLGGNHDYSFIRKGGGHNPILAIASQREDVNYVGFDEADVPILNGVDLKMWHPSGGVPYSVSYRIQKGVEQIAASELTNIVRGVKDMPTVRFVLSGHLHIQLQLVCGSIFGMQCGAFEGQTNYLKRKGLVPNIGGYIVQAHLGKNGLLKDFDAKFYLFDEAIDDYKNYKHSIPKQKITTPIFS